LLPTILGAAAIIRGQFPDTQFVLPLASTLHDDDIKPYLAGAGLPVKIIRERIHDLIRSADAVISVSGTVTLEVALVGTPMVIIYKLSPLTFQLAKRLVKVDHIGLCNIVAGETVAKELIQDDASPENIAAEIGRILSDKLFAVQTKNRLSIVQERLGGGGADQRMAELVFKMMGEH
jgi:lipid-A-disaccharide synthase